MKTTYFKIIAILGITINCVSCKAQQIQPLNTDLKSITTNSYLKDINNELDVYVGNFTATYDNKIINLFITKELKRNISLQNKNYYQDVLSIRYIVKNTSGQVLQDTKNMAIMANEILHTIYSFGTSPTQNLVLLYYGGTNCGIGWGKIILKKLNTSQLSWEYKPNDSLIDSATCPPSTDKTIYLPETKDLIFTKQ
ncbi:hypothetical protein EG359_07010 [Chryseobacterium joostei]|uniref:DUF6705 domain-containing protein n=1 Tax=Chryseobacterium joostei TaxID=112234 RepID=A0A1N7JB25_9FLAO|nr:hypothetical protein [Chryseobacterium joostei]AZA99365.1 hypothetical protein EG359_07010 [Chryseobacterium joostei]SIS30629.1 hypothetical protein SAMN05421768_10244 [Chryseobacterium joostei]SIS46457.1 hypothetical protein SAMN05421768_10843 [Chryseobacterium joostei]